MPPGRPATGAANDLRALRESEAAIEPARHEADDTDLATLLAVHLHNFAVVAAPFLAVGAAEFGAGLDSDAMLFRAACLAAALRVRHVAARYDSGATPEQLRALGDALIDRAYVAPAPTAAAIAEMQTRIFDVLVASMGIAPCE
jgi:hypothetical protein